MLVLLVPNQDGLTKEQLLGCLPLSRIEGVSSLPDNEGQNHPRKVQLVSSSCHYGLQP